jgi:hypothetical protein
VICAGLVLSCILHHGYTGNRLFPSNHFMSSDFLLGQWLGGSLVELRPLGVEHPAPIGGKRSSVNSFSSAARRRLQRLLASIRTDAFDHAIFITFTYPDEIPSQSKRRRDWDRMQTSFRREFPSACGIWRLEFIERKSGKNIGKVAGHYHFLVFNLTEPLLQWLSFAWYRVVGSGDEKHLRAGTSFEECWNREQAAFYLCKYAAKEWDLEIEGSGRRWGVLGDLSKIRGELVYQKVERKEAAKVARVCDGVRRANVRRRKKKSPGTVKWSRKRASIERSAFWFQNGSRLNENLAGITGLSEEDIEQRTLRISDRVSASLSFDE